MIGREFEMDIQYMKVEQTLTQWRGSTSTDFSGVFEGMISEFDDVSEHQIKDEYRYVAEMVLVGEYYLDKPELCCTKELLHSLEQGHGFHGPNEDYYLGLFIDALTEFKANNELNEEETNLLASLIAALESFKQQPLLLNHDQPENDEGIRLIEYLMQALRDMLDNNAPKGLLDDGLTLDSLVQDDA